MRTIFLLLLPSYLFCQIEASTTFCTEIDLLGTCIAFEENGRFNYNSWTCLSSTMGQGNYTIKRKSLILAFDGSEKEESQLTVIDSSRVSGPISTIRVRTYNEIDEQLPFVNVLLKASSLSDTAKVVYSKVSDIDGNAVFEIASDLEQIRLTFSFVGIEKTTFHLVKGFDYKVHVKLIPSMPTVINGATFKYRILKNKKKKLTLKRHYKGEKYTEFFRQVDKVQRDELDE